MSSTLKFAKYFLVTRLEYLNLHLMEYYPSTDLDIPTLLVHLDGICGEEKSYLTQRTFSNLFMWVIYKSIASLA